MVNWAVGVLVRLVIVSPWNSFGALDSWLFIC